MRIRICTVAGCRLADIGEHRTTTYCELAAARQAFADLLKAWTAGVLRILKLDGSE